MEELKRIMHIEDDESIRMITSVTLESIGGLQVLSCENGYLALEKFADYKPQIILLDVMMPDLDGPATLDKIKEGFDLSGIMVLFMTAKVQQEEIEHLRSIGGFDIIEKPFDPMLLTDKIKSSWESFQSPS